MHLCFPGLGPLIQSIISTQPGNLCQFNLSRDSANPWELADWLACGAIWTSGSPCRAGFESQFHRKRPIHGFETFGDQNFHPQTRR